MNETRDSLAEDGRNEFMRIRSQKEEPLWELKEKPLESNATHEIWVRELTLGKHWTKADWHRRGSAKDEWDEAASKELKAIERNS